MAYAVPEDLRLRLGKVISASSTITIDHATSLLESASAEIDVMLVAYGWNVPPLDLTPTDAAAAKALLKAMATEVAAVRFLEAAYSRNNVGPEESAAQIERDRLLALLAWPLPGLDHREPMDDYVGEYDVASIPASVLQEANRRMRAYMAARPRAMSSTVLEGSGSGVLLRPWLLTPVLTGDA